MKRTSNKHPQARRSSSKAVRCEPLEQRQLLAAAPLATTIDGLNVDTTPLPTLLAPGESLNPSRGSAFVPPGRISGTSFVDRNLNGVLDVGEPGIAGATVFLDSNHDGLLDPFGFEPAVVTDANGNYSIGSPISGFDVSVIQLPPEGYFATNNPKTALMGSLPAGTVGVNMAAVATTYNGTASADDYQLRAAPGGTTLQILVGGVVTQVLPTNVPTLTFNLGDGDDTFTVDYVNGTPAAGVVFNGGSETDALVVNGTGSADVFTADGAVVNRMGSGAGTLYVFVESLTINALAGTDTIRLYTLPSGAFGASAVLNGGDDGDSFTIGNGKLGDIQLPVTVTGGNGTDTVLLDDSVQTLADSNGYLITASSVQRSSFGGLTYSGMEGLTLQGQTGNNAYAVIQTAAATPVTINDPSGNNTFTVGYLSLSSIAGGLTIAGSSGTDALELYDAGNITNSNYTISSSAVVSPSFGGVLYSSMESVTLKGGSGNNTYNINSTSAPLYISDSGGTDTFSVNETSGSGVVIYPSAGSDIVYVNTDGTGVAYVQLPSVRQMNLLSIGSGGSADLYAGAGSVLKVKGLSITGTGALDLADGAMILDYGDEDVSPLYDVAPKLASGYAGGAWNGPGIRSSTASARGRALGYAEAFDLFGSGPATFASQPIDNDAVLVRYTIPGDANLDQKVDVSDLGILASNWQGSSKRWSQGNFNYDSPVNVADLGILASNWQASIAAGASASGAAPASPFKTTPRMATRLFEQLVGGV